MNETSWHARYLDAMFRRSTDSLDVLLAGISEAHFTDFPDYGNVGDSAIALGFFAYARRRKLHLTRVDSLTTFDAEALKVRVPVLINGGGNLGGLYPRHDAHRYRLAAELPSGTPLVQLPQSIDFVTDDARTEFARNLGGRAEFRIGVRDTSSAAKLADVVPEHVLAPDMAHQLGHIPAPPPSTEVVVLARRDKESATVSTAVGRDWPAESWLAEKSTIARHQLRRWPLAARHLNPSAARWTRIGQRRLRMGVEMLAPGATVITDRLHAMLISLQIGRRVIAIDNANNKLSNYVQTWLSDLDIPLRVAPSFDAALAMRRQA